MKHKCRPVAWYNDYRSIWLTKWDKNGVKLLKICEQCAALPGCDLQILISDYTNENGYSSGHVLYGKLLEDSEYAYFDIEIGLIYNDGWEIIIANKITNRHVINKIWEAIDKCIMAGDNDYKRLKINPI